MFRQTHIVAPGSLTMLWKHAILIGRLSKHRPCSIATLITKGYWDVLGDVCLRSFIPEVGN